MYAAQLCPANVSALSDVALTTTTVQCAAGYTGERCSACGAQWYRRGGSCWRCSSNEAVTAGVVLALLCVWVVRASLRARVACS